MEMSLATLSKVSPQEVYDYVVRHMLTQNRQSVNGESGANICAYRSPDGLKCAAGCLMTDAEYKPDMEGKQWQELRTPDGLPVSHVRLVADLQQSHDVYPPDEWIAQLQYVGVVHGLDRSVFKEFE